MPEKGAAMPRIPYLPSDCTEPADLVAAIRARRGGTLLNLDRMLLHSPPFARGWNSLLAEVRTRLTLPPVLRELAICAVALATGAEYEFHIHAKEFIREGGSAPQLEALGGDLAATVTSPLFSAAEQAVLRFTLESTSMVTVSEATFALLREVLADERQVVELAGLVATYNMVARFLVALDIGPE
jgi:alkylhydroperoxidase family enzyme